MSGKGLLGWLPSRANRRQVVERLVTALNAREYDAIEALMADDSVYLDTISTPLEGRAAFIAANMRLYQAAPDMRLEVDEMSDTRETMLVQGRMVSDDPAYCAESLWRLRFRRSKIVELQAFRDHNAISLPNIYSRAQLG